MHLMFASAEGKKTGCSEGVDPESDIYTIVTLVETGKKLHFFQKNVIFFLSQRQF
jgi:hypothetical protein